MNTTPPTEQQLAEIEARHTAATPGPWGTHRNLTGTYTIQARPRTTPAGMDTDGDIATLPAGRTDAESYANACFIAHAPADVAALLAENRRLRAELADTEAEKAKLIRWHGEDEKALARMRATIERLRGEKRELGELAARRESELIARRARIRELERPAVEAKRNEIRDSFAELAAAARETGDHEGAFEVECRLRDREEQWKREDSAATPA